MKDLLLINFRFKLAVIVNLIALGFAIFWAYNSNVLINEEQFQLEPVVTSLALFATLLGLNYVDNKLSKPAINLKSSFAYYSDSSGVSQAAIAVNIQNLSFTPVYFGCFQIKFKNEDKVLQIVFNGVTRETLSNITLNPGQSYTVYIDKQMLLDGGMDGSNAGEFVAIDQVDRIYSIHEKSFNNLVKLYLTT
ncbi:hypothetical protein V9789_004307 [Vibrio vulnificus]|nr:hypothetical protein [Vibrio vulnificus]ELP4436111.1 hypothetical protein [Vibrio vulnificus]ELT7700869.1 hypothetical protein [Vibrio vulnificus]